VSTRLNGLLLGQEPWQQKRMRLFFVSTGMYVSSGLMAWYAVWIGLWQPWQGQLDTAYLVVGHVLSYFYLRTRPQATSNQRLMLTQIGLAVSATDVAYSLGGDARAALLVIFAMHITFAMLSLSPKQTQRMGTATLASILCTSALMSWLKPAEFPWRHEVLHMGIALAILPVMLMAAVWVSRMRENLSAQNDKLLTMTAKLELLVQRDELTSLYNRRHMVAVMQAECKRAERTGTPLSVAMLDLDHFKRINDTLGHQVGDQVLQAVAKAASLRLRSTDVLARWGGEEFLLLMPATTATEATFAVARIRQALAQLDLHMAGQPLGITFSAGLTEWQAGESMDQMLERADQLLYRAKHRGRNCTEMITAEQPPPAHA
jgi:diguanylate cyclase (GGDEF)-like protein